jgi:hypothetical protein
VYDRTHVAFPPCAGDRRKVVRKVLKPLVNMAHFLAQADNAPTLEKFRKKVRQARRAATHAQRELMKARRRLSSNCVASLTTATTNTVTQLSCLP